MRTSRYWRVVLGHCILLIGCARDPVDELISRLSTSDVPGRRAAARTLRDRSHTDDRVIAAFTKSAKDSDMEVRCLSVEAIGKQGQADKSKILRLTPSLTDPEKRVRLEAALAIAKIDPHDGSPRPVLTGAMREGDGRTLLAIGTMGADAAWAVPTLVGLLSHESPQVRALAARTLGRIGPAARAAQPDLEAARRDPNAAVQSAAKEALKRIATDAMPSGTK